jgi:hypothetical protein
MVITGNQAAAAPCLTLRQFWAGALHNPESAEDWDVYVDRFVETPFGPHQEGFNARLWDAPFYWLQLENMYGDTRVIPLSWVDIWVFWCLMMDIPQAEALVGPWGIMDLTWDFEQRRGQFVGL